jgi:hypothetical protein
LAGAFTNGTASVCIWDTSSGKLLRDWPVSIDTLAISPDGRFVAGGAEDGNTYVWSVTNGEKKATLPADHVAVSSLAFHLDPRRETLDTADLASYLLAVGDAGGAVTLYALDHSRVRNLFRGSNYGVLAIAFSSDATLLATGGRSEVRLWDVATGQLLLTLGDADWAIGLAFSPDNQRLIVSRRSPGPWADESTDIYDVSFHRGT